MLPAGMGPESAIADTPPCFAPKAPKAPEAPVALFAAKVNENVPGVAGTPFTMFFTIGSAIEFGSVEAAL
jgi:hypothetical protein